ncbi:MAG TPA: DNA internalization-related competence protein ComEC/Rec2, partial [Agitococcus sp.]|nr:DNA internalization-related competence protein ComEC/Rec2 [Agitococcus sp.]
LWRWQIRQQFQQLFAEQANAGVVLALLTGDRALVADQAWDLYATTGISHLMAISGPHVLLAASAVTWLIMQLLMRFYPRIFLTIPKSQLIWPLLLMVAVAYGFLAGLSLPTLRTLMMLAGLTLLIGNRQEWPVLKIWLLALTMVLLWQPLTVHSVSLWLSFVAVGLLFFWSGMQQKQEHKITQFIKLQLWITLALTPITLALFAQVSWVSPMANLLAIPWVGFVIVPLALLGLLSGVFSASLQSFCWWLAVQAVNGLNGYLSWWAAISFAKQSYVLSLLSIGFFMFMVMLWLLPRQISPRYLSLFFFLPLFYRWPSLAKGEAQLSVLDVGQGLSVLIQTQKHQLLYDTGANTSAGERIINPYLHYMGVKKLDALMISHNDKDHTGGADAVFRQFIPQQLWYSAKPQGYQPPQTIHHECYAGQSWHW